MPVLADFLTAPWAVLPDRLPFIRAALNGSFARRRQASMQASSPVTASVARRRAGNGTIAVLPFVGVAVQRTDSLGEALGLLSLARFTQAFRAALADDTIGGIVIDLDSPGGSIYGVMELADEIYRSRARKPIAAIANSLAASGAYWIASAAREFYVTPGGEVGGIGVYDMHTDVSKGLEKAGIETTLISAGRYKTEGNPFQPLGADGRAAMQRRIDGYYDAFVAAVAKHRNVPESEIRNGMGQGRLLDAERAKRENMVDSVATLDEVVERLAQRVGQAQIKNASRVAAARQREVDALARPQDSISNHAIPVAASESSCAMVARRARQRVIAILSL